MDYRVALLRGRPGKHCTFNSETVSDCLIIYVITLVSFFYSTHNANVRIFSLKFDFVYFFLKVMNILNLIEHIY